MATRIPKSKPVAQAAQQTFDEATPIDRDHGSLYDDAVRRLTEAQNDVLGFFRAEDWKRRTVGFISGLIISGAVGYAVGTVGGTLLTWLLAGAVLGGASSFLMTAILVLGFLLIIYAGGKLGGRAGQFVYEAITMKSVDRAASRAWGWVTSPFRAKEIVHA